MVLHNPNRHAIRSIFLKNVDKMYTSFHEIFTFGLVKSHQFPDGLYDSQTTLLYIKNINSDQFDEIRSELKKLSLVIDYGDNPPFYERKEVVLDIHP